MFFIAFPVGICSICCRALLTRCFVPSGNAGADEEKS
jgi:hypothetical protein